MDDNNIKYNDNILSDNNDSKTPKSKTRVYASVLFLFLLLGSFVPIIPHSYTTTEPYIDTETYSVKEPYETTETETYYESVPSSQTVDRTDDSYPEQYITFDASRTLPMYAQDSIDITDKENYYVEMQFAGATNCEFVILDDESYEVYKNNNYQLDTSKMNIYKHIIPSSPQDSLIFTPDKSDTYCYLFRQVSSDYPTSVTFDLTWNYQETVTTTISVKNTRTVPVTEYRSVEKTREVERERTVTKESYISLVELLSS